MSRQIVKQSDGKFSIYSTIIDDVLAEDLTEKETIDYFVKEVSEATAIQYGTILEELNAGRKPYLQFQMTYEEMRATIKKIHG